MGVSTRTIRNDIKNLEKDYQKNGFVLEYKTRLGYLLKVKDEEKFRCYLDRLPEYLIETPEQRVESIIVEILLSDRYKTIEYLSKKFMVSTSQIKNDLKKVDDKMIENGIVLERRPHYGIKAHGSMENIQNVLREAFIKDNRVIKEYLNKSLDSESITEIKNGIKTLFNMYSLETNIAEFEEILSQLIILCIKANIRNNPELIKKIDIKENDVHDIIENSFRNDGNQRFNFTIEENNYLKELIKTKTKNRRVSGDTVDKSRLQEIIEKYFSDVDRKYNTSFSEDKEFFNLLYLHLASLIERAKRKQSVTNPFSVQISQQYPTVFNLAIQLSKIIEVEYDIKINQNEIGFIATHIAVPFEKREKANFNKRYKIAIICSSGGGSAYLIKLRLTEIFPNAEIENFSMLEEEDVISFDPDMIFSITELGFKTKAPVILINEILDELDNLNIKEHVMLAEQIGNVSNPKQYILSLFSKNHFECIKEKHDYKDILYRMSKRIVDDGACSETYPQDVWERESYLSTIYTNGVAIPHPIEMTGNRNIISVALIQEDIEYDGKVPKIIFMVSLVKGNLELHKQISKYLTKVMMNKDIVNMLNKSQSFEEFLFKLKMYIGG